MEGSDLVFYNPLADSEKSANRLPHWEQEGAVYFVTFRLADSVPQELLDRWVCEREGWMRANPEPWTAEVENEYHERFSGSMERWLDEGYGSCVLRDPDCSEVVAAALSHFEGERVAMLSWVVMPNHVHALFVLKPGHDLGGLIQSWKRFTSQRINEITGSSGTLWQKDYFDRMVRDQTHFGRCVRYIRRNPEKAKLRVGEFRLWESGLAKTV